MLFPGSYIFAADANGNPISGATWKFYRAGTLTPANVYSSSTLGTSLGSSETADAAGRFVPIYCDDTVNYRAILKDAGGTTIFDFDNLNAGSAANLYITPEEFGAAGDDTADDTEALQAAFDAISSTRRVVLLKKSYRITERLTILSKSHFRIEGGGTIKCDDDMAFEAGSTIYMQYCHHFLIDGITLDGNSDQRGTLAPAPGNLHIMSCNNYTLNRVKAIDAICDNFYFGAEAADVSDTTKHNYNVLVLGCEADNGHRQGLSMIQGRNIAFVGCSFTNTAGNSPQAGVDLESNASDPLNSIKNITFEGCRFEGNTGYGLLVASEKTPINIQLINCHFKDNVAGAVSWNGDGGSLVDCTFDGYNGTNGTRGLIDVGANSAAKCLDIVRARFLNITNQTTGKPLLYVHSSSGGYVRLIDTQECDVDYIANLNGDFCEINGGFFTGTAGGAVILAEPYCVLRNATFSATTNEVVQMSDNYCAVLDCRFLDPTSLGSNGLIRVLAGSGLRIQRNTMRRTSAAGKAITIASGATVERLEGNTIDGFTGTPIDNGGTISVDRSNYVNGALRTETAIAT